MNHYMLVISYLFLKCNFNCNTATHSIFHSHFVQGFFIFQHLSNELLHDPLLIVRDLIDFGVWPCPSKTFDSSYSAASNPIFTLWIY